MGRTDFKGQRGGANTGPSSATVQNGPVAGAYSSAQTSISAFAVSQTDARFFWFIAPSNLRLQRIVITNSGQAITAYKARRKTPASGTGIATGDTQILGGDGGAVSANTTTVIDPTGSGATLLLAAQREILQGDQLAIFISNGAVAPDLQITVSFNITGHIQADRIND